MCLYIHFITLIDGIPYDLKYMNFIITQLLFIIYILQYIHRCIKQFSRLSGTNCQLNYIGFLACFLFQCQEKCSLIWGADVHK